MADLIDEIIEIDEMYNDSEPTSPDWSPLPLFETEYPPSYETATSFILLRRLPRLIEVVETVKPYWFMNRNSFGPVDENENELVGIAVAYGHEEEGYQDSIVRGLNTEHRETRKARIVPSDSEPYYKIILAGSDDSRDLSTSKRPLPRLPKYMIKPDSEKTSFLWIIDKNKTYTPQHFDGTQRQAFAVMYKSMEEAQEDLLKNNELDYKNRPTKSALITAIEEYPGYNVVLDTEPLLPSYNDQPPPTYTME